MTDLKSKKIETTSADPLDFNATAILDFNGGKRCVKLKLEGAILNNQVNQLRDFLRTVAEIPGNQWAVQLGEVDKISRRGLQVLVKFAKEIRRRGYELKITSIQPALLATLSELNFKDYFVWKK